MDSFPSKWVNALSIFNFILYNVYTLFILIKNKLITSILFLIVNTCIMKPFITNVNKQQPLLVSESGIRDLTTFLETPGVYSVPNFSLIT